MYNSIISFLGSKHSSPSNHVCNNTPSVGWCSSLVSPSAPSLLLEVVSVLEPCVGSVVSAGLG